MQQDTVDTPVLTLLFTSDQAGAGTVLSFGITGSVSQASMAGFPTGGFTATCWFQTTDSSTTAVLWAYGTDDAHRLLIQNPGNLTVGYGSSSTGGTGIAINDGQPHYVALSIFPVGATNYGVALYVDGMPAYMGLGALSFPAGGGLQTNGTLVLGRTQVSGSEASLQGTASEFRLWSVVRTSAQITDDMQVRTPLDGSTPTIQWQLTSAATSGTVNLPASFVASDTPYFRTENLTASWTSAGEGATYELLVQAADGSWSHDYTGLTATSQAITGYGINVLYSATVRATVGGTPGAWSTPGTARTLNLGPIDATLASGGSTQLQAQWLQVDQALGYAVTLYSNGSSTPSSSTTQTGTTYDLMPLAAGSNWWNWSVRAGSEGALGPANQQVALTAPVLTFGYYNDGTTPAALVAAWASVPNALYYYLVITKTNAPTATTALVLSGSTTSYSITTGLAEGDTYTATVRAIGIGTVGQWSAVQTVVIHNLVAPTITSTSSDGTAHTITFGWAFDAGTLSPTYTTQLYAYGAGTPLDTDPNSPNPKTFTNPAIQDGSNFQVRVRAQADNSYGRWSALTTVSVGLPPQVTGVQANADTSGNITATWSTSNQPAGVTYSISLTGNGIDIQQTGLAGPPYTFAYTDTHVVSGDTYTVSVWGVKNGLSGLPGTDDVTVGSITPVDPNNQGNSGHVMDPVSVATGMYQYANTEMQTAGIFPLLLSTSYSTATPSSAESSYYTGKPLGERWNHSYNTVIVRNSAGTEMYVLWGSGRTDTFLIPASITGTYQQKGVPTGTTLTVAPDLTITVTTKDQMVYMFTYAGRMTAIYSAIGNRQDLSYNGSGLLQRVTDVSSGRHIDFAYNGSGYLQTATDNSGRQVSFSVNGGNLTSVTDVNGNPRTFTYTGASLIETITDQNHQPMLKNSYQDGRVVFQQNARALVAGESWGTTLAYRETTANGIAMMETTVTDPEGNVTVYTSVQANGNTTSEKALLAGSRMRLTTSTYDGFNNLTARTIYEGPVAGYAAGNGNTTSYTYDANNNPATSTNPIGETERFVYDSQNNLRSYTDVLGNTRTWLYSGTGFAGNLLRGGTDLLGRSTAITYMSGTIAGLYDTIVDVLGNTTRFAWSGADLQQVTNPLGGITAMQTDSLGRVTQIDLKAANGTLLQTMTLAYKASGSVTKSTVQVPGQAANKVYATSYGYDGNGNVTSLTNAASAAFTYGYDPNNLLITTTCPPFRGGTRITTYAYNKLDALISMTLAAGITELYGVNQFGELVSYTDANGNVYTIDRAMEISGAGPYPLETTMTYPELTSAPGVHYTDITNLNAAGVLTGQTNRAGETVTYAHAPHAAGGHNNLVITTTLPPAAPGQPALQTVTELDPLGRLVAFTNAAGAVTTRSYAVVADPASGTNQEVATTTDPMGNLSIETRDALGRVVKGWLGKGAVFLQRELIYDMLNRIVACTEGNGTTSATTTCTYSYDAATNTVTASIGRPGDAASTTVLRYDGLGRLASQTDAVGNQTQFAYAPWSAIASFTSGDAATTAYNYDAAGRFYQIVLPAAGTPPVSETITHVLDADGNRLQTSRDGITTITRTFDQWNRLLTRTGNGATVGYGYTPIDLVGTLTYPDTKQVTYAYNGLAQLSTVTDWSGRITQYAYHPSGMLAGITNANGTTAAFAFNAADQLTGITQNSGALIIAQSSYTLDALGNRIAATEISPLPFTTAAAATTAVYNGANEMTQLNGVALSSNANGNLNGIPVNGTMQSAAYDWFQQLVTFGGDRFAYDEDGLRTQATVAGTVKNYVHDVNGYQAPWQQMASFNTRVTATAMAMLESGGYGQVPFIGAAGAATPLNNAVDRVLAIADGAGTVQQRFVYGLGLIGAESGGAFRVFHFDSRGSTIATTSETGAIADRYAYGAYGAVITSLGTGAAAPFLYNGRDGVIDDNNGLLYMRARNYSPSAARFLQRDYLFGSITSPHTLNRYSYVEGNPISNIDPLGLKGVRDTLIALGSVAAAGALGAAIYFGLPYIGAALAGLGGALAGAGNGLVMAAGDMYAAGGNLTLARGISNTGIQLSRLGQAMQRGGQYLQTLRPPAGYQPVPMVEIEMTEIAPAANELAAGGGEFSSVAEQEAASLLGNNAASSSSSAGEIEMQTFSATNESSYAGSAEVPSQNAVSRSVPYRRIPFSQRTGQ
ncbi:MAG TPA: RHS repeat-associated core domain-containing protein [Candidatus Kapabacteria bacterium]|nr:RHS repeat-associated core domain-containing protein [Candidatus Kapabacteria bacterium]